MRLHDRAGEPVEIPPQAVDYVHDTSGPGKPWRATIIWRPPRARFPASLKVREPKELIDAMMEKRIGERGT